MSSLVMNTPLPKHYSCRPLMLRPSEAATAWRRNPVQCTTKFFANPRVASTLQDYHLDVDPSNNNIFKGYFASEYEEKLEKIGDLVKSRGEEDDPIESLIFVDTIQRLGMAGHYRKEIDTIMQKHYLRLGDVDFCGYQSSLLKVSLSFRMLRQRGYHVSADVFNNFKGRDGKFRDELKQDVWGLLELFEATHLSFEQENILNEAQHFSSQLLDKNISANTNSNVVEMRFKHPFHRSIARLNFQRDVRGIDKWTKTLTELSEMDFLRGKCVHREELRQLSKWWKDLGLTRELNLARNEPSKWYTWSMAMLIDDISLSSQRLHLSKSIAFIYLIDDIFDLYGTIDELILFTEAVQKWDYDAMNMLPDYMKPCYKSLLDTTNEIGWTICKNHGYNPINSLNQTWASLCNAFLVEAKWFASENLPDANEYLANGKVSSGVHVVLVHLFFLLGHNATNLDDISNLISSVAAILRLWDDLGTAEDEHQNGTDGSYIQCYMNDQPGVSYEQAREHVSHMIEREWKRLNKECFNLNNYSIRPIQEVSLNLARMVPLMYSYDDNQRLPVLAEYMNLMLLSPAK
ncbi:tricyclene synthase Oc15, chloroplastic-like isoform X1 [Salvia hispanica]|uniref:tricyclene synthase Oc15, chloroplastic-like isoform X1 n=1 Tax=Salvia hispanica TaxID=49212 RepID=UPI0020093E16|nr:tricyclene synthase Oc15, chloroplastic-like isoform X1 [Salvia hispanica]